MRNFQSSGERRTPRRRLRILFVVLAGCGLLLLGSSAAWRPAGADDYSQGKAALRSGDYAKAKQCFESALRGQNNLEESRAGLIRTLRDTGAYAEALKRVQEFLAEKNQSAIAHLEQGLILAETGKYSNAEEYLRASAALAPAGSAIRLQATRELGDLLETVGRRNEARVLWEQILNQYRTGGVKGSQALGIAAVAAWRCGYAQDAKDIFIDATDPKLGEVSLDALADFGYLFLEKYNATEAIGVFRDCLKINKSYARALLGMALAKKYGGDIEVEAYSRAALKVNPNLAGAWNALAQLAIEEEAYDRALQYINAALGVNPANLESLALKAFCLLVQGNEPGFSAIEKHVLEINPSCGRFYHILADNLVSRKKYQEAVDWSRKATRLQPELWTAHVTLGMNLTRIGDLEEGRKAMQRAFDGDPFNVWAYNSLELFDQMNTFARSQSEHFLYLMSKEDVPALSSYAPELAEEVYAKLTRRYGFQPNGPIQVEIFLTTEDLPCERLGRTGFPGPWESASARS